MPKWQIYFIASCMFTLGFTVGMYHIVEGSILHTFIRDTFASSSPWTQTDWSGGTTSGTVTTTVTTSESTSNIDTSTSGQVSLSKAYNKATLKGTQLSTSSTNFNVASSTALQFNTSQSYDDAFFTYDGGSPTQLVVDQDGDYFLSFTMDLSSDGGEDAADRNGIEAEVRVNGVKQGIGRSSYIRNYSTHNEGTVNIGIMLNDLSASDYIEVYVVRTTNNTDHNITGPFTLYVENVADSETIFNATATRTVASTNLNTTASELQWTEVQKDSGFTHSDVTSPEDITLDSAGNYFVAINVPLGSAVQRASVKGKVLLNGSQVDGGEFAQGYIRNASSHTDASIHWFGVVQSTTSSEVLSITTEISGASGTVTVDSETASIFIQKLPTTGVYFAEATQVGGANNWNPTSETAINWATDNIIDSNEFTHDTTTSNDEITVVNGGDYLLGFNASFNSSLQRGVPSVEVKVNGTNVTGAVTQSSYMRGASQFDASTTLYFPLLGLAAGDVISLTVEADGVTGTVNDTSPALLFLVKKDYVSSGTLTSNIFDAEFPANWETVTFNTSGSGTVTLKARSDSNSDMSGATAWASCSGITSGSTLSDNACVTDIDRYLQYQITLEPSGSTPVFEDISIGFSASDTVDPDTNATSVSLPTADYSEVNGVTAETVKWYNEAPTISWTAGADNSGGAGLEGYCIALEEVDQDDTSTSVDPGTSSVNNVLTGLNDGVSSSSNCPYVVTGTSVNLSTVTGLSLTSGKKYYFSIKAVDIVGNVFDSGNLASGSWADQVLFSYDGTSPTNPSFISLPSDFISTKEATMIWPISGVSAGSDDESGLSGIQYRIGSDGTWYGENHTGDATDVLTNDGSYTFIESPDFNSLTQGNNLIYIRTLDNVGNVSSSYVSGVLKINTSAPGTVQNLAVTPEDAETNEYSFSWELPLTYEGTSSNMTYCYTVNTAPTANTCNFTSAGQVSLSEGAYATQPGINTLYVVAKDEAGNINYDTYSSIEFTYSGSAPGIPSSLDIADISVKATSSWKLALSWEEPSDIGAGISSYKIFRSTTETTCSESPSSFTELGTTAGISYTDTGLSQETYYYCVQACDSANNCGAKSSTISLFPDGKFTTAPTLTADPTATGVTTQKSTISWSTSRTSDSKIAYGTSSGSYYSEEVSNSTQVTSHSITLTSLNAGTTYYYKAKWTDEDGNSGESDELTFTTDPAPLMKDVSVSNISISSAIVEFTAVGATKVKLYYGPTTTFGGLSEISTSTTETTYTIQLTGLQDDTKYFYKINGIDSEGEEYEGTILDFVTLPRPEVSNVQIQELKQAANPTVLVSWETNTDISSIVTYYPEGNPGAAKDEVDVARVSGRHRMILRGLNANNRYTLIVKGLDLVGNEAVSEPITFNTATDTRPPIISDLIVEGNINVQQGQQDDQTVQLIISWNTDEGSTSQVEYGEGTGTTYSQQTQEDGNFTFNHVVIISGLRPSQVYHVRAISKDAEGNVGKSIDTVSIAPKRSDSAFGLVIKNLTETFGFLDVFVGN